MDATSATFRCAQPQLCLCLYICSNDTDGKLIISGVQSEWVWFDSNGGGVGGGDTFQRPPLRRLLKTSARFHTTNQPPLPPTNTAHHTTHASAVVQSKERRCHSFQRRQPACIHPNMTSQTATPAGTAQPPTGSFTSANSNQHARTLLLQNATSFFLCLHFSKYYR